jgi:histidine ammonia-lyase
MRDSYRSEIAFIDDDVMMYKEIQKSVAFIKSNTFIISAAL